MYFNETWRELYHKYTDFSLADRRTEEPGEAASSNPQRDWRMPCASRHPATTYSPANHAPMRTCEQSGGIRYDNAMKNTFNATEGEIDGINYWIDGSNYEIDGSKIIIDGGNFIIDGCKIICNTFKHSPVFRLGGDEFVAFLQGEDYNNRAELLSGFQKKMNKEYFISGAVSIASGMSDFIPQKDINALDVFKRADEAMYKTKAKMKKQRV